MKRLLFISITFFSFALNNYLIAQIKYVNAVNSHGYNAFQMIVSPDNKFAYVVTSHEIQSYQRNPVNGQLTFLAALSQMTDGTALYNICNLAMSWDSRFVYTEGTFKAFIFSRDTLSGLLTPFQTLSDGYFPSLYPCTNNNIVASKDKKNIYITGRENLFIYKRDLLTDSLRLIDTIQNLNLASSVTFDASLMLSSDNKLAFITGGNSISVYKRDTVTGMLTFKNIITGTNFANTGLAYARESVRSSDDKYIYTVTNSMGSGAVVVLSRNTVTDSLSVIQTLSNSIRPQYINISNDNKLVCISSGAGSLTSALMFFEVDSTTGKLSYISTYMSSAKYDQKKYIDMNDRYIYTCPAFTDSIYIHRFNLFLDSAVQFCVGSSVKLQPFGNYISYLWSTGSTNSSIVVNTPGKYYLMTQDPFGSSYSDSVYVSVMPLPTVNLGNDTTLYLGQSIYLQGGNTNTSWTWNINNGHLEYLYLKNDTTFFGIDTVIVTVTNSNNCSNSDTVLVTFSPNASSITYITQNNLRIYPNPVKSQFTIEMNTIEKINVDLYDVNGRHVFSASVNDKSNINVSALDNGIYTLAIKTANHVINKKLIVLH